MSINFNDLEKLSYNVTVPAGRKVLLKLDGVAAGNEFVEHWLDNSTGTEAKVFNSYFDFSALTNEQKSTLANVLIFPLGGSNADAAGQVVISELRLTHGFAGVDATTGALDLTSRLYYVADKYSYVNNTDGSLTVNYTEAKGEWDNIFARIISEGYASVTIEVTGTADKQVLFKFENEDNGGNNKEQWHTCNGSKQTVTVDITSIQEAKSFIFLMFATEHFLFFIIIIKIVPIIPSFTKFKLEM